MRLLRVLILAVTVAPSLLVSACATERAAYRPTRYERERAEARRILQERLNSCLTERCRARARQDYDLRMAQIEQYRM